VAESSNDEKRALPDDSVAGVKVTIIYGSTFEGPSARYLGREGETVEDGRRTFSEDC
jgi:hypothetical protein